MGSLPMLVMFVALLAMWYFMSRSQKKQQQERQNLLDSMKSGDEVVTMGDYMVLFQRSTMKNAQLL